MKYLRPALIATITSLLLTSASYPTSAAGIKIGASCSKKGERAKQGSQFLICTVKGKKLTWTVSKVQVKTTTPSPAASPAATPAPSKDNPNAKKIVFTAKDGDSCSSGDIKVGYAPDSTAVVLDCGPDGKLHPMNNGKYKVNEYTGKVAFSYNFSNFPAEVRN